MKIFSSLVISLLLVSACSSTRGQHRHPQSVAVTQFLQSYMHMNHSDRNRSPAQESHAGKKPAPNGEDTAPSALKILEQLADQMQVIDALAAKTRAKMGDVKFAAVLQATADQLKMGGEITFKSLREAYMSAYVPTLKKNQRAAAEKRFDDAINELGTITSQMKPQNKKDEALDKMAAKEVTAITDELKAGLTFKTKKATAEEVQASFGVYYQRLAEKIDKGELSAGSAVACISGTPYLEMGDADKEQQSQVLKAYWSALNLGFDAIGKKYHLNTLMVPALKIATQSESLY